MRHLLTEMDGFWLYGQYIAQTSKVICLINLLHKTRVIVLFAQEIDHVFATESLVSAHFSEKLSPAASR